MPHPLSPIDRSSSKKLNREILKIRQCPTLTNGQVIQKKPTNQTNKQTNKQKTNREMLEIIDAIKQMYPTDIYRTLHPNTNEYTFSATPRTFPKTDHILRHKASLNRYKKIKITSCILSDHQRVKLQQKL
jgi:exonuclease III